MKFVNLKTGEIAFGNMDYNSIDKPYTFSYNENDNKFENSEWVELDDQMVAPMIILNRKGYETEFCCSGHVYEGIITSYVKFKEPIFKLHELINEYKLNPDIFSIEGDKIIRINEMYKEVDNPIRAQRLINRFCEELLEWAIKLPDKKDCRYVLSTNKPEPLSENKNDTILWV